MKVMGIIFANDATLGALTDTRTMASLPYGGRYRQVDFQLSNLAAAGIRARVILSVVELRSSARRKPSRISGGLHSR